MRQTTKCGVALLAVLACVGALEAVEIPKASGKALGVTKSKKSFDAGLVFVNGKFIRPPYVVERWGNGIRINETPVIGQVVDWTDFLKTQSGVKITKTEAAVEEKESAPEVKSVQVEATPVADNDESSLDDLFDDDPKPKASTTAAKSAGSAKPKMHARKPATIVSYSLDGDFVPNAASKALVKRVNDVRTDIELKLRTGGFIFFGDRYSRISGDHRAAIQILDCVPDCQQRCADFDAFTTRVRAANLVYLTHHVCEDLFRNRVDYRVLQERRKKWRDDLKWKQISENLGDQGTHL